MKRTLKRSPCSTLFRSLDDAADHVMAMMKQETLYRCEDYLSLHQSHRDNCEGETRKHVEKENIPSPQHMLLAVEECIRFIDSLAIGPKSPVCITSSFSFDSSASVSSMTSSESSTRSQPPSPTASNTSLRALFQKKGRSDSVSTDSTSLSIEEITCIQIEKWRSQMCCWAFTVVDRFEFDREIVAIAFSILDRYLALEEDYESITRADFQLMSMTSLYTAIKVMQPGKNLAIRGIVEMSRGFIQPNDVKAMELKMLMKLDWRMNPPTALAFVRGFLPFLPVSSRQRHELMAKSRCLTELAVGDPLSISYPHSSIAVACIFVSASHCKGVAGAHFPDFVETEFCANLERYANIDGMSIEIAKICDRLEHVLAIHAK